jgi:tetratricopeptide (TPR) repeat protein
LAALLLAPPPSHAAAGRKFEWTTKSAEAKRLLADLQAKIENFEVGQPVIGAAEKVVAADPSFAMGEYYLSAVQPAPGNQAHLDKAVELSKKASDGERRFIETMVVARANQGADVKKAIPELERLGHDYAGERLVQMILGQVYVGQNEPDQARAAFEKALAIGPKTNRARAFIASDDLLHGEYAKARETLLAVEHELPKGTAPFVVRYGIAFSYLYQGQPDPALQALQTYLNEYKDSGAAQGFPEVFIWNSIARINLENGRLDAAMQAYENGYSSVPGSNLPEDQKTIWLGRLHHGKCRTLARMGKAEEAWAEAETVRGMIEKGGEQGKQFLPAYHYLAGYLMLEKGDTRQALEHLKQANTPADPFHTLLLARAYERTGDKDNAKKSYALVVESKNNGLERALAFPEAKQKLSAL